MAEKVTLSVVKASVGGLAGRATVPDALIDKARETLSHAVERGLLLDYYVTHVGDDLDIILTHTRGESNRDIHKLAWDTFTTCTEVAKKLKLFGAGYDLLSDVFSGTLRGMGPGCAEMEFLERRNESVVIFMANKCGPGAWNLPLTRVFADPFNTPGLVIDPSMRDGFAFEVLDTLENRIITLQCPGDLYDLLLFLGSSGRFVVNRVIHRLSGEVASVASTQKAEPGTARNVTRMSSVLFVRCHGGLPSVGELTEAFAFPHAVSGWMRGTHQGPLMPVAFKDANCVRFDGPPRVIAAGFQIANGRLVGPVDLFDDLSFDGARKTALEAADYFRRHGPFEPHRLPHSEMEQTHNFAAVIERHQHRFTPLEEEKKKKSEPAGKSKSSRGRPVSTNPEGE